MLNSKSMDKKKSIAEDPSVLFGVPGQLSDSDILTFLHTKDVNWKYINMIKELTGFNDDVISEWLNISVRTFRTYRQPDIKFKDNIKEHILLLLSLIKHGIQIFGSSNEFDKWLNAGNFYFDNKSPNFYLNTVSGIRFVDDRLTTMEFGDNV